MVRSLRIPPLREFLLRNISHSNLTSLAMKEFCVTRVTIHRYLNKLIEEGLVTAHGQTSARKYKLKNILDLKFEVELSSRLSESAIWDYKIRPSLVGLPDNILNICEYGFTEILNNAIDHSASFKADITVKRNYAEICINISDEGVGIFEKIQKERNLESPQEALLELSKGKLTSDPKNHAGEGIYFTSRMFNNFSIRSGVLFYHRAKADADDWLIEVSDTKNYQKGTAVNMEIPTNAAWTTREVFNTYQDDDLRFRKTHVPIALALEPGQGLVSRSQAKRILARFEQFTEIILDFKGVPEIGQAFADEVFRIFLERYPETPIIPINTTVDIDKMIAFVRANAPR